MKKFVFVVFDADKKRVVARHDLKHNKEYVIGRAQSTLADIQIEGSTSVSRKHAKLIVGKNSVSIEDLGSVNGTFKDGTQIKPNQLIMLKQGMEIKFAEAPYVCEIQSEEASENDDQDEDQPRSRSRSQEKAVNKPKLQNLDEKSKKELLWNHGREKIKQSNQIWNMGDLNEQDKKKMMKLMGVKDNDEQEQADQSKTKQEIKFRNHELERQFQLATHHKRKTGLGL